MVKRNKQRETIGAPSVSVPVIMTIWGWMPFIVQLYSSKTQRILKIWDGAGSVQTNKQKVTRSKQNFTFTLMHGHFASLHNRVIKALKTVFLKVNNNFHKFLPGTSQINSIFGFPKLLNTYITSLIFWALIEKHHWFQPWRSIWIWLDKSYPLNLMLLSMKIHN